MRPHRQRHGEPLKLQLEEWGIPWAVAKVRNTGAFERSNVWKEQMAGRASCNTASMEHACKLCEAKNASPRCACRLSTTSCDGQPVANPRSLVLA